MSMAFAFSVPGLTVLAAERRWTRLPDYHSFEGSPKLLAVPGGYVAAVGAAGPSIALLAALQGASWGAGSVTPDFVTQGAQAAHALFGAEFKVGAILRTADGPQLMTLEQPSGNGVVTPAGFYCGLPFDRRGDYSGIKAMAEQAAHDCRTLALYRWPDGRAVLAMPPVITRIARLFREAAARSPFVGTTLDVGVFYGERDFYLHGTVEQLEDERGAQRTCITQPGAYRIDLGEAPRTAHVAYVGSLVRQVWVTHARFGQGAATPADPYGFAEDSASGLEVITEFQDDGHGGRYFEVTFDVPPEGHVEYVRARPYYVRPGGTYQPGPSRDEEIQPLTRMQPIVDSDDHETATHGYFWIRVQDRGLPLTSITMGRQTSPSNIVQGLTPTRGPGDTSVVKGGTLAAGEYEAEVTLPQDWQSWLWFDLVFAGTHTMRVLSAPLGPNRTPAFAGTIPLVVGTTIWIHGNNTRSIRVQRKTGAGTWRVDRDTTLPEGVDVSQQDDLGNAGLSSGTESYLVTLYSDPIAGRNGNTMTAQQTVSVTASGSTPTYTLDIMTVAAPAIGDTSGSVTYKASSSTPAINTRRRYRVNFGAWEPWVSVPGASPANAPTTSTTYSLPGLPSARTLTGQLDPPQYQVDVEVEGTLYAGATEHDVQVRSFSYTTNADDV